MNGVCAAAQMPRQMRAGVSLGVVAGIFHRLTLVFGAILQRFCAACHSARKCRRKAHGDTRFPLCAEPERLSASRPCAVRAAELRHGARRGRAARCCASRTSTRPAAVPEYEQAIFDDLAWLGIAWEQPVRRQSEHLDDYRAALARLEAQGLALSELRKPRRDRRAGRRARARAARGRAIRTARRSIRATRRSIVARRTQAPDRSGRTPTRCGSTWRRPSHAPARSSWTEAGQGPSGETGTVPLDARGLGRCRAGAQGNADQLSPLGCGRRRAPGRDPCGARAGPVLRDRRPPPAAIAARPAGAGLSPPSPASGCRRTETLEIDAGDGAARTARAGCDARGYPADGGTFAT